jgi:Domain of unknown function (DUF4260)
MILDGRALNPQHINLPGTNEAPTAKARRPGRIARRHLWLVPGLVIALYANAQAGQHGLGLGPLLLFGIVPHLPALLGIGQPHAEGQMAPRAVPLFNAMHHPVPPLVVLAFAAAGILSPFWLVGALAWFSHIVVDQAFGHGLRTADGRRRPWWTLR